MKFMSAFVLMVYWGNLAFAKDVKVTVMTFNVENLFDVKDDPGKNDETFLPLVLKKSESHKKSCAKYGRAEWKKQCLELDWSQAELKKKMEKLSRVLRSVGQGRGPDVLILQEVENREVLEQWRNQFLTDLKYEPGILIEGDDLRGIDVAVLTRLKTVNPPLLHKIHFRSATQKQKEDSRGILQVNLKLPESSAVLTVFAVHFPAPFHPVQLRMEAFQALESLRAALPKDRFVVAAGDFNVPSEEDKSQNILATYAKNWLVTHKLACSGCRGTNYYPPKKSWSFLDMILLSKNLAKDSGWQWIPASMAVVNDLPEHRNSQGHPQGFDPGSNKTGVSDHFPIKLELQLMKAAPSN